MGIDRIARARSITNSDEAAEVYADWAETYDEDVFGRLGFTGSTRIADLLVAHLAERTVPVLDLGCGTGAVGLRLAHHRVSTIDGVDLSPEMLAIAASTGVYRTLRVQDLSAASIDLGGRYGATVSAGTFTTGHVGPDAVAAVLDAIEPGGLIAWVIGAEVWPSFEAALVPLGPTVLHQALEPIRRDGDLEAVMYVARRRP